MTGGARIGTGVIGSGERFDEQGSAGNDVLEII